MEKLNRKNPTTNKKIKELEFDKTKKVTHNNVPSQRKSYEDLSGVEEITNKVRFITDNCVSRKKKKKMYTEVVESRNSNINKGIKCGKNYTILTINKHATAVCKNSSEEVNTSTKICNKPLLNQNIPQ